MTNLRHNIDPLLVALQVEGKIHHYKQELVRRRTEADVAIEKYKVTPELFTGVHDEAFYSYLEPMYIRWIQEEREHYAKVRVIKFADRKYLLVYGNTNDNTVKRGDGTGPFKTLREAKQWFLGGGR